MARGPTTAIVAILKDEEPFVDEWLAYHRLLGIEHFYLYDNSDDQILAPYLRRHHAYVTVVDWAGEHAELSGRNKQTKAYEHSLGIVRERWVAFIDGDEFIVLRQHASLPAFLAALPAFGAVLLSWHVFGHCGYFENPQGLVTELLVRRQRNPGRMTKSINAVEAIRRISSAHLCELKSGFATIDANGRAYSPDAYQGKTDVAHINHYMCRSFLNWMHRLDRGEAAFSRDSHPPEHGWRFEPDACLRRFVEYAKDFNEHVDDFMVRYADAIRNYLAALGAGPVA